MPIQLTWIYFQSLFCLLNNKNYNSIESNCLISSLAAGAGYLFYPRYIVFTMAISNAVEALYKCYEKNLREKKQKLPAIMKIINKIPVLYFMFLIGASLDLQLRVTNPSLMNKFVLKAFNLITNGRGDRALKNLVDMLMGYEWSSISIIQIKNSIVFYFPRFISKGQVIKKINLRFFVIKQLRQSSGIYTRSDFISNQRFCSDRVQSSSAVFYVTDCFPSVQLWSQFIALRIYDKLWSTWIIFLIRALVLTVI